MNFNIKSILSRKKKEEGNENEITKSTLESFGLDDEEQYVENELEDTPLDESYNRNARSEKPERVKKSLVYFVVAVIGFLIVFFLSRSLFSHDTKDFTKKPEETVGSLQRAGSHDISNPATVSPNDYVELQKKEIAARKEDQFTKDKNGRVIPKSNADNNMQTGMQNVEGVVIDDTATIPSSNVVASGGTAPAATATPTTPSSDQEKAAAYITSAISFFTANDKAKETESNVSKKASSSNTNNHVESTQGFILRKTTIIPATLLSGINSDLGGNVIAQVRQDVYDSETGMYLLIPEGSRLIGHFDAGSTSTRIGVIFTDIILPNGTSIALTDNMASDDMGYPGLSDKYSTHRATTLRNGILSAIFAAAMQRNTGYSEGKDKQSPGQEAMNGAVANVINTFNKVIDKDGNLPSTVMIRPGFTFNVMLNQDIRLSSYKRLSQQDF